MRTPFRYPTLLMVVLLFAASCGASASEDADAPVDQGSPDKILNVAFVGDMQVPDPDIFYEVEGNLVVTSAYEGLVRYVPDSAEIEPALAESWTVSDDGLTYTFALRPDVSFPSGATMDADTWITSFQRRIDVEGAPSYMLADVVETAAPDPLTFVVTLGSPVSAFLDYMAAPYGPKAVDPTVLESEDGGDLAQSYLASNSAGTGPYQISRFELGQGYELTANPTYWDGEPYFTTIDISIVPDVTTQRLMLENGELDMILHGLPVADVESFRSNPDFQVIQFPVLLKTAISANPNKGMFEDPAARAALQTVFDKAALTEQVYRDQASISTQIYPAGVLPAGLAADAPEVDSSALEALIAALPDGERTIDMAYSDDEGGTLPRLAEIVAAQLGELGAEVTVRPIPIAQVFDLVNDPLSGPDLLLWTFNPDAAEPDGWIRIFMNSEGPVNFLQCSVPEADALMDQGLAAVDEASIEQFYAEAGSAIVDSGCYVTIADLQDVVVARAGITGFVHQLPTPYTVRLKDLREE